MDAELRRMISNFSEGVSRYFDIEHPVKNMRQVVEVNIGGSFQDCPELDELSTGSIQKVNNDSFMIKILEGQSEEEQNFTIAHELGHLFLHMGYMFDKAEWDKIDNKIYYHSGNSEEEMQANEFAAAFLMPEDLFLESLRKHTKDGMTDTGEIAKEFHVSSDVVTFRGKGLGYLQW